MIVRLKPSSLRLFFILQGSILPTIAPRLLMIASLATVIAAIHHFRPALFGEVPVAPFTLLGLSLSLFLGFRNNACYDRWWEARKLWGQLINDSRSLCAKVAALPHLSSAARPEIGRLVTSFAVALKNRLRDESGLSRVPGFENAYLLEIAPQVGIRETRRLAGEHVLSGDEVVGCASFDDSIGVNGWPLELHVAGDVEWRWPTPGSRGFNQLPLRMLLPGREGAGGAVVNLLVAGRCASMTHDGQSAARVSGPCFVMGQAAGTAARLALNSGARVRDLPAKQLQRRLEADGAYLG
jgi:hypothetical protein